MSRIILCCAWLLVALGASAQDKWDLKQCVAYALANNISIKQADLSVRSAELDYQVSKGAQLPTINGGFNAGYNFGLGENPTTGTLENQKSFNTTTSVQSGITLFNWFTLRNQVEASRLMVEARKAQSIKKQNDIALDVAVQYLQILINNQSVFIATVQIRQDQSQLDLTRKKVNAGVLPELNAAELEAQLASDSSGLITAQSTLQQSILAMKSLLNIDAAQPFAVTTPPVAAIPLESLADLQPEAVYQLAMANLPQQRANELIIASARKQVEAARGQLYPNISAYGNLNTRFAYFRVPTYSQVISGYQSTGLRADAGGGSFYNVQTPVFVRGDQTGYFTSDPLFSQLSQNFGQGIGIGIQVPILNGRRARINLDRSKLNIQQLQLQNDLDKQTLKQDIYTAFNNATASLEKFNASRKAVEAAAKAYDFAQKRYGVNLLSTYDLLNSQNRLARAQIDLLSAQFEYVFRMKLLEFYKGQGLKL